MDSLVSGIFSAIASIKTENARMTVTPRAIFSPEYQIHSTCRLKNINSMGVIGEREHCTVYCVLKVTHFKQYYFYNKKYQMLFVLIMGFLN